MNRGKTRRSAYNYMMNYVEVASWLAVALTTISMILAVHRSNWSWIFSMAASSIWLYYALNTHQLPLTVCQIVFMSIGVWGLIMWNKKD